MLCFQVAIIISTKKSARASRSHIKVALDEERGKLIISGNQIKKRASNALFLGYYIEKKRKIGLVLCARVLKLFWNMWKGKTKTNYFRESN